MGTVAILMGEVAIAVGKAPIRIGEVPIPRCDDLLCKYGARIPGCDAPIRIGVFPFGIVVLATWMGMTHSELENVRSAVGGMPDPGAEAVLRGGIAPGRKGTVATWDGGVPASSAPSRAGSVPSLLEGGRGRNGEGGMPEARGEPPARIGSSPDRNGTVAIRFRVLSRRYGAALARSEAVQISVYSLPQRDSKLSRLATVLR